MGIISNKTRASYHTAAQVMAAASTLWVTPGRRCASIIRLRRQGTGTRLRKARDDRRSDGRCFG